MSTAIPYFSTITVLNGSRAAVLHEVVPTFLTLTVTRSSIEQVTVIPLGNGAAATRTAAEPSVVALPTEESAASTPASSSTGISDTAIIVIVVILVISLILFVLCCICKAQRGKNRSRVHSFRCSGPCCRRVGPPGHAGPQGPQGVPGPQGPPPRGPGDQLVLQARPVNKVRRVFKDVRDHPAKTVYPDALASKASLAQQVAMVGTAVTGKVGPTAGTAKTATGAKKGRLEKRAPAESEDRRKGPLVRKGRRAKKERKEGKETREIEGTAGSVVVRDRKVMKGPGVQRAIAGRVEIEVEATQDVVVAATIAVSRTAAVEEVMDRNPGAVPSVMTPGVLGRKRAGDRRKRLVFILLLHLQQ
ncbi:Uu.00g146530.m01.CDS01 [Anthostomella pinea]|uniref:Uu.00g146530.m01.CDS01 n=1 Tax=Anthostomella pinea TaxID=933095 RepID=A0AAI8VSF1_9PEZI|nr:Uu.00g146530.m01.CDS01 [Anthostomella pinea]